MLYYTIFHIEKNTILYRNYTCTYINTKRLKEHLSKC